jgi:hypothetical protein
MTFRQRLAISVCATVFIMGIAGVIGGLFGTVPSSAQVGANLPFVSGVTVQNSVTTIVAANPSRRGLKICNVGATNDVWIAPVNTSGTTVAPAALGAGSFLLSRSSAAGANVVVNCLNTPADVTGGSATTPTVVTAGFAGITNAATSPVTVWEY